MKQKKKKWNQLNQINGKNSFEASFKPMWQEIKIWSYLEFKKRDGNWEISKRCFQKQSSEMFCKKKFSKNFCKFHWKTSVLESLFNKVADLRPFFARINIIFLTQVQNRSNTYHLILVHLFFKKFSQWLLLYFGTLT